MSTVGFRSRDCMIQTFSYLNLQTLGRCCLVNREWNTVANSDVVLDKIFPHIVIPPGVPRKRYIAHHVAPHVVTSIQAIVERFQTFARNIKSDCINIFQCFFLHNPEISFFVELGHGNCMVAPSKYTSSEQYEATRLKVSEIPKTLGESLSGWGFPLSKPHSFGLREICILTEAFPPRVISPTEMGGYLFFQIRGSPNIDATIGPRSFVRLYSRIALLQENIPGKDSLADVRLLSIANKAICRLDNAISSLDTPAGCRCTIL